MKKRPRASKPKNFMYNTEKVGYSTNLGRDKNNPEQVKRNLSNYITPVQLTRLRTDVSMWRDAIAEAERAYYPFRVKMQRIFIDTILNGHVYSLMERRKDLTLLRKYAVQDANGKVLEDLTKYFERQSWFRDFVSYSLDALFFGYSLISLGDIDNDKLKDVTLVPRWFVSADREEVCSYIYAPSGQSFLEDPYRPWHVYVKTPSDSGVSPCGYGLLYQIALYEIVLRNTLGFNTDFVELYAMPYRVGKTTKTDEVERAQLANAIANMGSAGWAIVDPMDDIEFLETNLGGTGYQAYDNLEKRCEAKVAKLILGHADAMDSTPGKLGGGQGKEESPAQKALIDKQTKDGAFIETVINEQLFPRLQELGLIDIPEGARLVFLNDGEEEAYREAEDRRNLTTAQIAQTMKNAGLKMSAEYFEERTGIECEEVEVPAPLAGVQGEEDDNKQPKPGTAAPTDDLRSVAAVRNELNKIYS